MGDQQDPREKELKQVKQAVQGLKESPLYAYRVKNNYKVVFGEGNVNAPVMFIGEAPGKNEAQAGRPFVGAAGRVLNNLLESTGLKREDVYITNVVKDRPPQNRDPNAEEVATYAPFLKQQIEIIRPRVIVTLGRFAMEFILSYFNLPGQGKKIGDLHGKLLEGQTDYGQVEVLPLYHPAAGFYNDEVKKALQEDIQALKPFL